MIPLRPINTEMIYVHTGKTSAAIFFLNRSKVWCLYRGWDSGDKKEKWQTVPIYA